MAGRYNRFPSPMGARLRDTQNRLERAQLKVWSFMLRPTYAEGMDPLYVPRRMETIGYFPGGGCRDSNAKRGAYSEKKTARDKDLEERYGQLSSCGSIWPAHGGGQTLTWDEQLTTEGRFCCITRITAGLESVTQGSSVTDSPAVAFASETYHDAKNEKRTIEQLGFRLGICRMSSLCHSSDFNTRVVESCHQDSANRVREDASRFISSRRPPKVRDNKRTLAGSTNRARVHLSGEHGRYQEADTSEEPLSGAGDFWG
ncbi:hypothetical protein B0O99DRAFT_598187 [Bisporella sp. PMI_857]|nr:hypothetical protein B0O99DRAFT_598187 [Bisporella sp. PMI_857]